MLVNSYQIAYSLLYLFVYLLYNSTTREFFVNFACQICWNFSHYLQNALLDFCVAML